MDYEREISGYSLGFCAQHGILCPFYSGIKPHRPVGALLAHLNNAAR